LTVAVQDYELLLRVRADLIEALNGLKGLNTALGDAGAATGKLGESEAQATDRIKAMVQASRDQQQALQGAASATRDAADQSARTVAAYDQQAASAQRAAAANVDYNRSFSQAGGNTTSTASATAQLAAQRAEMAKLAQQIDPTVNALAKLDAQERSLNAMRKAGVVGIEDYQRFKAVIDANRLSITGAGNAMHSFSLNTAQTRLEMGRLIKDIGTGQWGRLASTGTTLANQAGFISALFSPIGLAIGGIVGSLGLFAVAAIQAQDDAAKFNQAIIQTGNYAGVTSGQLTLMATQMRAPFNQAESTLQLLVQSGKVTHDRLQEAGQAAIDLATVTGENIKKTVAEFVKLQDDPVRAAKALDDSLHVLTLSQYENIKALAEQGDADSAAAIAQTAFADALRARAVDVQKSTGLMAKAWDNLKSHVTATWNAMMKVGAPTTNSEDVANIDQQLDAYRKRVAEIRARSGNTAPISDAELANAPEIALSQDKIKALLAQKQTAESGALFEKWVSDTESQNTRINTEAKKASDTMDKYLRAAKSDKVKAAEIAEVKKATAKLIADNPAFKDQYLADEKNAIAGIEKKFKAPRAPREKSDAGAVAAQQQLIKLLGDEQGALDPTVKVWADYNDKVAKANELAAKAKTARGADIAAITAQRDAVIANAGAVRDAALDKEANKDREAFEKLQQSLQNANGIKFEQLVSQLNALQKWLDKGVITASEYHDAVQGVLNTGLKPLPKYKGLDGAVGGAFGELDKVNAAGNDLDSQYTDQLKALNKFHEQKLLSDQDFVTKENALYTQYYAEKQSLQRASDLAIYVGMSTSLEQSAQLVMKSVGKNSEAYRIAFAASKAAAIAQATMNMFKAISNAGADVPFPANIPAMAMMGASMVSLLAQIASLKVGYAAGGYTGPGGKHQPAGIVHAGEVVFSQRDVARHGGVAAVESLRLGGAPSFADGGYVPALPSLGAPLGLAAGVADAAAARRAGPDGAPSDAGQTHIHVWSMEEAAQKLAEVPSFQSAVVHIVGDNPRTIQGKWGR